MGLRVLRRCRLSRLCAPRAIVRRCGRDLVLRLGRVDILTTGVFSRTRIGCRRKGIIHLRLLSAVISRKEGRRVVGLLSSMFEGHFRVGISVQIACGRGRNRKDERCSRREVRRRVGTVFRQHTGRENRCRRQGSTIRTGGGSSRSKDSSSKRGGTRASKGSSSKGTSISNKGGRFGGGRFHGGSCIHPIGVKSSPGLVCKGGFRSRPVGLRRIISRVNRVAVRNGVVGFSAQRVEGRGAVVVFTIASFASAVAVGVFTEGSRLPRVLKSLGGNTFIGVGNIAAVSGFSNRLAVNSVAKVGGVKSFAISERSLGPAGHMRLRYRAGVDSVSKISRIASVIHETRS